MSNEPIFNFDFEGVAPMDAPSFTVIKDFGQFRLAAKRQVTMFQSGQSITIPEIQVNGQPWTRKGIKEGGKTSAYFFTREAEKQNGEEFTEVRIFTSMSNIPMTKAQVEAYPICKLEPRQQEALDKGETVWICDWSNLQVPAIQALDKKLAASIGSGQPFWGSADNWNIGKKPNVVDEGTETEKKYYERYWYNFVDYGTKAAMVAAREAHFASLNGSGPVSSFKYPAGGMWPDSQIDAMRTYVKTQYDANPDGLADLAKQVGLTADAVDDAGQPVAYKAILADILGIPEPLITV